MRIQPVIDDTSNEGQSQVDKDFFGKATKSLFQPSTSSEHSGNCKFHHQNSYCQIDHFLTSFYKKNPSKFSILKIYGITSQKVNCSNFSNGNLKNNFNSQLNVIHIFFSFSSWANMYLLGQDVLKNSFHNFLTKLSRIIFGNW